MSHHFWDWNKEWYGEISFPGGSVVKNTPTMQESQVWFLGGEDPLEKEIATCSVFLPGKSHGQRRLAGYRPWSGRVWHHLAIEDTCTEISTHTPINSRKSYKCVKTSVSKQNRLMGRIYSFSELFHPNLEHLQSVLR